MKRRKIHIQKRFFVRAGVDRKVLGKESPEERKKKLTIESAEENAAKDERERE